jgi:hypothetical protein
MEEQIVAYLINDKQLELLTDPTQKEHRFYEKKKQIIFLGSLSTSSNDDQFTFDQLD